LLALQISYDVELTYTPNAIEGNTLTLRETAEVIEHGITVGGKSLREPAHCCPQPARNRRHLQHPSPPRRRFARHFSESNKNSAADDGVRRMAWQSRSGAGDQL
jgi:hypothetical protein